MVLITVGLFKWSFAISGEKISDSMTPTISHITMSVHIQYKAIKCDLL